MSNDLGMVFVPLEEASLLLSRYETRVKEFNEYRKARNLRVNRPSFSQSPDDPVVNVSWTEAQSFCAWLTQREQERGHLGSNQVYRLPMLDEWRDALPRQFRTFRFAWGDNFEKLPNSIGNVAKFSREGSRTMPVGSFPTNACGFADLVGNVAEWTGNTLKMGELRYVVGGGWDSKDADDFRLTAPPQLPKNTSRENIGFRCLLDLGVSK
jgi:formylglycine-generating enzyme required for sulfatase activity